jgi:hypothetical protein
MERKFVDLYENQLNIDRRVLGDSTEDLIEKVRRYLPKDNQHRAAGKLIAKGYEIIPRLITEVKAKSLLLNDELKNELAGIVYKILIEHKPTEKQVAKFLFAIRMSVVHNKFNSRQYLNVEILSDIANMYPEFQENIQQGLTNSKDHLEAFEGRFSLTADKYILDQAIACISTHGRSRYAFPDTMFPQNIRLNINMIKSVVLAYQQIENNEDDQTKELSKHQALLDLYNQKAINEEVYNIFNEYIFKMTDAMVS